MALPKIELPIYDLKIPSSGKEIQIRPFKVKEEKLLLMANESKDENEIINTTKQIVSNCILTEGVDVDKLPFFDVDFLFIVIRSKSVGEKIEMRFTCNAINKEGNACGNKFDAEIDLAEARVMNTDVPMKMDIGGGISVKFQYPSYSIAKEIQDKSTALDNKIRIIASCIEVIAKGYNVYTQKDFTRQELIEFIEELTEIQYRQLESFVDNFPYFLVRIEKTCPKCGFDHVMEYTDLTDFFQ